jgi:hypothetical protein
MVGSAQGIRTTYSWPGMPAFIAGVTNGTKIIAVNARRFSHDELERALRASRDASGPMELIVENGGFFKTVKVGLSRRLEVSAS